MTTESNELNDGLESPEIQCATPDTRVVDWSRPVTRCVADDYSKLALNNNIYNADTLSRDLWVELPAAIKQFVVTGVHPIKSNCAESLPITEVFYKNLWLRIPIELVDTSSGYKIYRIECQHRTTLETMSLYFSYIIQDDNPAKPYIYMKQHQEEKQ